MNEVMSKASFTIAYDGPALSGGTMDVRQLAPALLAVGQLIDAANEEINGRGVQVAVNVRATQEGCFEIDLEVIQSVVKQVTGFLTGETVTAGLNLVNLLGLVAGIPFGLLKVIAFARGRQPTKIEKLDGGMVKLTIDGETLEIPMETLRLYKNVAVRKAAQDMVAPLEMDGIDTFEARGDRSEPPAITIRKEEVPYFQLPDHPAETLTDDTVTRAYTILSLAFKDGNKWRLYDGQNTISATIEDEDFLAQIEDNKIAFSKNDLLVCRVRQKQTRGRDGLKTEFIVLEVIDHKPAWKQIPLDLPSQDDGPPGPKM